MKTVLIVEDTVFFGLMIKDRLKAETSFEPVWVRSMSEAIRVLDEAGNNFFAAILDFNLPDAPESAPASVLRDAERPFCIPTQSVGTRFEDQQNPVESVISKSVHARYLRLPFLLFLNSEHISLTFPTPLSQASVCLMRNSVRFRFRPSVRIRTVFHGSTR
ncbi:MAG: response regulator [Desulfobacteraceae bacterium]|nr:response regulator [Desulfobacteraceae bacterium]